MSEEIRLSFFTFAIHPCVLIVTGYQQKKLSIVTLLVLHSASRSYSSFSAMTFLTAY